jgi:hypothetical protein
LAAEVAPMTNHHEDSTKPASQCRHAANMDWLREAVAEYLSGFSTETGSPHAARSGFLTQLCRGRRRVGIDDSAACGRTGRVMLGKFDAAWARGA